MQQPPSTGLRFDAFEIDIQAGELRRNGLLVRLQPQPLKVLALLATHAGEVLSRQRIEQEIWGEDTHVDFDLGLNYCIKQIRSALEDDAETPKYIQTLPRRGYRFIAAVERAQRSPRTSSSRVMLAVLPFGNLTGQVEQEYFVDGMTDELIGQLGRLRPQNLGVIALTSAKQYKDTAKGIDQIGRELGVDYIIEGTVRRAGDRVRIAVQLIQVSDQCHLWAEAYNRTLDDIITIQTDVAERVARSLMLELLPADEAGLARMSTRDPVAYDAYLKGWYYWNKRTEDAFSKALQYFQSAIDRAPNYAPAYVGLADVYDISAFYSGLPPKDAYEKSRSAIAKALELDSNFAEAHTSLAYAKLLYEWDFSGAEKAFNRALELNPNHVTGHYWFALFLAAMQRSDEAMAQIGQALELDPLSLVINCHKGWILYFARRYADAAEHLRRTIEMDETFALAHYFLGLVYIQMSQFNEASDYFQKAIETSKNHPAAVAGLATSFAFSGKKVEANELLKTLEELAKHRYVAPYYFAMAELALGNKTGALDWLERACEERSAYMSNLKADPAVDSLRTDGSFIRLLHRIGLPNSSKTHLRHMASKRV